MFVIVFSTALLLPPSFRLHHQPVICDLFHGVGVHVRKKALLDKLFSAFALTAPFICAGNLQGFSRVSMHRGNEYFFKILFYEMFS